MASWVAREVRVLIEENNWTPESRYALMAFAEKIIENAASRCHHDPPYDHICDCETRIRAMLETKEGG